MDNTSDVAYEEERWTDELAEDDNARPHEEENARPYEEEDSAAYSETSPEVLCEAPRHEECQLQSQSLEAQVCPHCKKNCSKFRCLFADLGPGYDRTYENVKSYFETALNQAGVPNFEDAITKLTVFRKRRGYGQSANLTLQCGETGLTLLENPPKTAIVSERGAFIPRVSSCYARTLNGHPSLHMKVPFLHFSFPD
jgi:hypothetical protein